MVKYVYRKTGSGRGRPTKFVQTDDGKLVPYKEYEAQFGKLSEVSAQVSSASETQTNTSAETGVVKNTETVGRKPIVFNREFIKYEGRYHEFVENGIEYKTVNGTPIKMVALIDSGSGIKDAVVVVPKKDGRSYRTIVKVSDIEPCPVTSEGVAVGSN